MPGAAILVVFLIFAALMYLRVVPALLAVPAMAVVMAFVAGVPAAAVGGVVVTGASSLAPVYVAVIFGAMLGRVTIDTGIARTIVNFAAEFGGERPIAVALLMSAIVAMLFVSLSGLGAVIMVGSIVLPIMMTTGVPRKIAATMFLMAFALGFIFNIVNWKFYTQYFGVSQQQLYGYAIVLACVDAIALVTYTVLAFRASRGYAAWAIRGERTAPGVPWFSLIAPVLPIALYFFFHLDPVIAFAFSAIYGAVTTRPSRSIQTLVAAAIRGVEDVAPAIVLFIGIGMLLTATKQPQFAAAMSPLVSAHVLRNPAAFVAIFGLLSPLALYRGPLNPFGVGIAIFTVLLGAHVLPAIVIVAAVMAVVQVQNVCDPTNTQNVWVANYTGVPIDEITKRTLPYQVAVATVAAIAIVAAPSALFGRPVFDSLVSRADAATPPPAGMFAGAAARERIAVGSDGTPDASGAVTEAVRLLSGTQVRAFALQTDPNAAVCADKPYAAYVLLTSTRFALVEGTDLDLGIRLFDCGGWEVNEWHDHQMFSHPDETAAEMLLRSGVTRMQQWAQSHPQRWSNLLAQGLAYQNGDPPSFYYALYKTVDGNMRAYVRAGGPAYASGIRSGDVVSKIDGAFWWEFGTYQSQERAYDGKPHTFELERGTRTFDVALGEPFAP